MSVAEVNLFETLRIFATLSNYILKYKKLVNFLDKMEVLKDYFGATNL